MVQTPTCSEVKELYTDKGCCPDNVVTTGLSLSLSPVRHQDATNAECWDLLNQRWTQIISEKDTGGMVTVMKVNLPNGCNQLAHVHCGLHEAFYKLDNKGDAIWASQQQGEWYGVEPQKGDWSYAAMGIGHGYTNGEVGSCDGNKNVADYSAMSYTSHFVIKMPGYEHETRARTVAEVNANPNDDKTCNMMSNKMAQGYSQDAKDAIAAYGATDPKFIPALVTLATGSTYSPKVQDVKPLQYTPATDESVGLSNPQDHYTSYGAHRSSVRRLMSPGTWAKTGESSTGNGGVARMDEIKFTGSAPSTTIGERTPVAADVVLMLVDGRASIVSVHGYESTLLPAYSGVVVKKNSTDLFRISCLTDSCTLLDLRMAPQFSTSYMQDTAYRVPWHTMVTDVTADYVTEPWGPSKNTYQRCAAANDNLVAPSYQDFDETSRPTGAQPLKAVFACSMSCIQSADATLHGDTMAFTAARRAHCTAKYNGKSTPYSSSAACPEYLP